MQGPSRATLAAARDALDELAGRRSRDQLLATSDELFAAARLLDREHALRRALTDPGRPPAARRDLARRLFSGQVGRVTLELLARTGQGTWSEPTDLVQSLYELGAQAAFLVAEQDESLDDVEDELFRFARILAREPRLRNALADRRLPAERKAELLNALLTGKVRDVTMRLVDNIVRNPRTRSLEEELDAMAARAAQRRERWIAHVSTAVALTDEQARRLGENLGRIYDHPVQLHVELTPELLGGLRVRVRDEVIDASVASQLEQARRRFGA